MTVHDTTWYLETDAELAIVWPDFDAGVVLWPENRWVEVPAGYVLNGSRLSEAEFETELARLRGTREA